MKSFIRKILQRGVLNSAEIFFNRIVPPWVFRFSVGDVLELDLQALCDATKKPIADELVFSCVESSRQDLRAQLRSVTWNSVPIETTESDLGYAITKQDDPDAILGGVWGGRDSFSENNLGFRFHLEPDQGWIYCAYINETLRGMGAYQRLLAYAARDLGDRGCERLLVMIQPWNKASLHVHRKNSTHQVGRIFVIRLFRFCGVFCTGALTKDKSWTLQPYESPVVFRV